MISVAAARKNTLLMNAFYLMLSTFVVAASGLVFWIVVTRAYDVEAVGLATTLLSISGLLSLLGLAGFDTALIRFLPGSTRKNDYINSGLIIVALVSLALGVCLGVALPILLPTLSILGSPWGLTGFAFFTVITSLNTLTNAIFLAHKQARYIFAINVLQSICKIALPLLAVAGNAMTIFVLAGIAQLIGLALSIAWMHRKFGYTFSPRMHVDMLRTVRKFSFYVYTSSILNLLPPTVLPLVVVHLIGPANAAYYYMAFTIAGVLYTVAYASMQSVFAEGSHDQSALRGHVSKAAVWVAALLVPAAVITLFSSSFLLNIFGQNYAGRAGPLLQLFALGAIPVAAYSAMGAIFKVTKNLRGMVSMNVVYAVVILGFSYALVPQWGLIAVGWAWIIGNLAACGTGAVFLVKSNKR